MANKIAKILIFEHKHTSPPHSQDMHNNRELDFDLTFTYMPLTTQSKFSYLYNISTTLERKNISRTVYEVVLSLQMTE